MKILTVALMLMLLGSPCLAADQVYKWKDASGTTHFSATPPEGAESTQVNLPKAPPPPSPPEEDADGPQAQRAAACLTAQNNLETLRNNPTVEVQQDDGSRRTLGPEEREVMKVTEEKRVEMFCGNADETE